MLKSFTDKLIGHYPNTYCYSKSLAESMLKEEADHLPIVIVRPSMVVASNSDPFHVSISE